MHAEDYNGTDQIRVGNGQGLHISNSGHGLLPTPSRNLHLFSLFHVPQIKKNLISVNQFTRDNLVFIRFHPTFFCVKDLRTCQLLLQGPSKLDLYPWPSFAASSSRSPAAFLGEKVSLPLQSSTKLSSQISCPCLHQSPPSALHVNRAKVLDFISVIHLLFQILPFNCCFLMYGTLPL
jgi:hypothetical protein